MDEDFDIPEDDSGADDNPILVVGQEKEIGDKGLKKKLLKVGQGSDTPDVDDEVHVHLTGTVLNGMEFESSGTTAFTLGRGHVVKGLADGVKTMKKGEKALFTIPPELAYGGSGYLPKQIPPNATLRYDVELLSWFSVEDICKDGGLFKRILKKGEKWENPKDLDEVLVNYEAHLDDGKLVAKSDKVVEFTVKDGHFCPALSMAVRTMKKGEEAALTVKPQYGFGETGEPAHGDKSAVPANAILEIKLELISWRTVFDVTEDKMVVKKIMKEGEGYKRPKDGADVKVKLTCKLKDGTVFFRKGHGGDEAELFEFTTDEAQVIRGLDRAVMSMKKGEVASLTIAPKYGFGSSESRQELAVVPANSTLHYEVELVSFIKRTEDEKRIKFRKTLRDAVREWAQTKPKSEKNKDFYHIDSHKVKLSVGGEERFPIFIRNYKWQLKVLRVEKDAMDLYFGIYTMGGQKDNILQVDGIDSFLVSIATLHPHYSHMHHFHDSITYCGGGGIYFFDTTHKNAYSSGDRSFEDSEGFVNFEIQVQAISSKVYPPFLSLTYKMELFEANREFVLAQCSKFMKERQTELKKVINNSSRWSSLCDLLKDENYIASQFQSFSVKADVINKMLVNTFYRDDKGERSKSKEDGGLIACLILDMIHQGYELTRKKNKKCECVMYDGDGDGDGEFQLKRDFSAIFHKAACLKYDSAPVGKADSDSLELDFELQEKIGLCDLFLDDYVKNTPKKKKARSKGSGTSKGDKRMQSQTSVPQEEGEHNVETHGPKTAMENEAANTVKDEAVGEEELDNTFVDVSVSVIKRVIDALNETYESHAQLVNDFDAKISALLGECDGTYDAYLLTQKRIDIYNKAARNVADLYEKHLYKKHINPDFNLDVWADVNRSFKKRYTISDEQAKKIGKIGEKLANAYLTEKYNDKENDVEIRWLNEVTESNAPYDLALFKGKDILRYFEVKITGIPEKFWFSVTPNEIHLAAKSADLYSVVFIKVNTDLSADVYEIKDPLSKGSELQAILRTKKEAKPSDTMTVAEVKEILNTQEAAFIKGR